MSILNRLLGSLSDARATPNAPPWFDLPDSLQLLERRRKTERISDSDFEHLRHWAEHGYLVMRDVVPARDIDQMQSDLDHVWTATQASPGLRIEDLRLRPEDPPGITHAQLVAVNSEAKARLRNHSRWRIHEFWPHSKAARRIFQNGNLKRIASLILGVPAEPLYSINFTYGSEQAIHQDTGVFHVWPMNYLIGIWLACEDVHPDSGPLVYYAGSHKEPLFSGFSNYPMTNLRNCPQELIPEYYRHLERISERYERRTFIAQKGEVFLWHGLMIHGGASIRNPALTRKSYVCHYMPPGSNKIKEVEGPFNW